MIRSLSRRIRLATSSKRGSPLLAEERVERDRPLLPEDRLLLLEERLLELRPLALEPLRLLPELLPA